MEIRNILFIMLGIILIILFALGLAYHFRDRRTYELNLPEVEELNRITIKRNAEGVEISDTNEMKKFIDVLYGVKRISEDESIQDSPVNIKDEIKIDFYLDENNSSTIFVYKKNFKYYIEQPYNGIYRISVDEYNSIEKYIRNSNDETIIWKLENDKEVIETVNSDTIKEELDKVDVLESQHLILTPSKSINDTNYIQTYNDISVGNAKNENEKFHIEICFKDEKESFKLIAKDNLTKEETTKIFIDYFENHIIPDVSNWYKLEL